MMIRQGKIKNLIQLMTKMHSQKNKPIHIEHEQEDSQRKKEGDALDDRSDSMTADRKKLTIPNNMDMMNVTTEVGIFFTQDAIKPRFDQKKTLYEVYRDSLQKKKKYLNHLSDKKSKYKLAHSQDEMRSTKQIYFPIGQNSKLRQRRQSENYNKFKKKSVAKQHFSIPFLPHQANKRIKSSQDDTIEGKLNSCDSMRNKKMSYKPLFRVKRIAIENIHTEPADQELIQFEKYSFYKKLSKADQADNRKTQLREFKDRRRTSKILLNKMERFSGWDSGDIKKVEDGELAKLY